MAWSNQKIISKLIEAPISALECHAGNPQWTVGEIIRHTVFAANGYVFRLTGQSASEIAIPESREALQELAKLAEIADERLRIAALLPDAIVEYEIGGKVAHRSRSTIISQAIHHATEHRAQLVSALDANGISEINLDNFDLWSFTDVVGE